MAPTRRTPQQQRGPDRMQGHWLLASLGKRVLRPGGAALSQWLVARAEPAGQDVVELAPGLGRTATAILATAPRSYVGVDSDPVAVARAGEVVGSAGVVVEGDASATGLEAASADVVLGEAMLTMQGDKGKEAIVAEAARLLRPGGRYAIHELALTPDDVDEAVTTEVRTSLATAIKVNARPLTQAEWSQLLERHGFEIRAARTAPMALLEPRRVVADEGALGTLRILGNLLRRPDARRRVLRMRATFRAHQDSLAGVAIVARRVPS